MHYFALLKIATNSVMYSWQGMSLRCCSHGVHRYMQVLCRSAIGIPSKLTMTVFGKYSHILPFFAGWCLERLRV